MPPRRDHLGSKAAVDQKERDAQLVALRKAGVGYREIAERLGYASWKTASAALKRVLSEMGQEDADLCRQLMVEQLNEMYRRTTEILVRHHPVIYQGQPVTVTVAGPDGTSRQVELEDDGVKLQAIDRLLKTQESMRRLLGLDLPARVEVTGEGGGPVQIDVAERATALADAAQAFLTGRRAIDAPSVEVDILED